MFDKYLVTGATGFLGLAVVRELVRRGETVRALVLEGDPCAELLPRGVDTVIGDVCVKDSLAAFSREQTAAPAYCIVRVSYLWPPVRGRKCIKLMWAEQRKSSEWLCSTA